MSHTQKILQQNKRATFDYDILLKLEAGIVLQSYEIKQIINKKFSIQKSFARIINNEIFLFGMNIQKYVDAVFYVDVAEERDRKLLLHKKEIRKLANEIKFNQHLTIVPLDIYINTNGLCKLTLALCKGKTNYDKRHDLKEKDIKMNSARGL
jgi:SsrA-binding protein